MSAAARARVRPAALRAGSTLAVVSPASATKPELVQAGMDCLHGFGYKTVLMPHALDCGPLYYAGTVEQRVGDLHAAFADTAIDGIVCTRGGWGSAELLPYLDARGLLWVPQQLGGFRRMPFGLWTVCLHHNRWTAREVSGFRARLRQYRGQIANFREVIERYAERRPRLADRLSMESIRLARSVRRVLGQAMGNPAL